MHKCKGGIVVRAYIVNAKSCHLVDLRKSARKSAEMEKLDPSGFFELFIKGARKSFPYRFRVERYDGEIREFADAYSFPPSLTDEELYLFGLGDDRKVYEHLGSHLREIDGVKGTAFAVWAPTARRVSVVGDFNSWVPGSHPMQQIENTGIWEAFVPGLKEFDVYKYCITSQEDELLFKADPYAFHAETRPSNGSKVYQLEGYQWGDEAWQTQQTQQDSINSPINIYEMHAGSWRVKPDGAPYNYSELADELIP